MAPRQIEFKLRGRAWRAVLTPDLEAGGFTVEVPDLPGVITEADSIAEARRLVREAAALWLDVDGAHAAWLLVQHADRDPAFQKECLEKMKQGVSRGEVSAKDVAYLVDRVAVAENKKQVYGTQFKGKGKEMMPQPIEDEQHVDERRKSVGLPSMAEYKKQMDEMLNSVKH